MLLNAVEEALSLAHSGNVGGLQARLDRLNVRRRQAEQWRDEIWGPALLRLWERVVTNYVERFVL